MYARPNLTKLLHDLNDAHFNASKLDLSPRKVEGWKNNDLISVDPNDKRRIKFSVVDAVWLKIIDNLRHFGISYENILEVKSELFRTRTHLKDQITETQNKKGTRSNTVLNKSNLTMEEVGQIIEDFYHANYIEATILESLIIKEQCAFVIDKAFVVEYVNPLVLKSLNNDLSLFGGSTSIFISLTRILSEVLSGTKHNCQVLNDFVINKEESDLLDCIRNNKVASVVVETKDTAGRKIIKKGQSYDQRLKEIEVTDLMLLNQYKSFAYELIDGTKKRIFKTYSVK